MAARRCKFSDYFYNGVTAAGVILTIVFFVIEAVLFGIDFFSGGANFYLGILTYVFLPPFLIIGLILIPLGALGKRLRIQKGQLDGVLRPLVFDPTVPTHRNAAIVFLSGSTILLVMTIVGAYKAFHYTESVHFCGIVCHEVMKPEHTAYMNSSHARVKCVECHIGPGANWYVRSKMSGLRQVYRTAANNFDRPIPTPVHNLRPSKETCEQCHWPAKFFGAQQKVYTHYLADETNSPWEVQMLIKVGGGDPSKGAAMGIHWHMNIENTIDYIATDDKRTVIPWVRSTDPHGTVTEYMSTENPITPEKVATSEVRRMDCIDCHNRPSHVFHPPDRELDQSFIIGRLDVSLPYLKQKSIELLNASYTNEHEAEQAILTGLSDYYQKSYPEIVREKGAAIQQATQELIRIYKNNYFPEMKVDWRTHPNHIGHMISDGCFRCHDGMHKSKDGKVISNDCNACHTFIAQGPPDEVAKTPSMAQEFRHPVDVGIDVTEEKCTTCHAAQ
ncbi:MAG: NapC/NirT family cytochrome c [Candidatus Omnitrophota bacterium]|nr:NapC/NirT family cytochrome c [Candidatus Omnitrophota bacterium]